MQLRGGFGQEAELGSFDMTADAGVGAASDAPEQQKLVVGIDLGTASSYVGFITKGVVDIVQNEVSQRKTPALVGFTDRERMLGDSALSQIKSNAKNTCRDFKHLLGQRMGTPVPETESFWSTCPLAEAEDGCAGYSVMYKGEPRTFSAVAITAMFLTKLKEIAEQWAVGTVVHAVVGVPAYFTDANRQAMLDASKIAGLHVLRVMNEHAAVALAYGMYRSDAFDADKPTTVVFCSMGHATFSVCVVQFVQGKLTVLCERSDRVGGRDMDECLMRCFAEQFKKKTGCDVLTNKKASFKLEDAVTRTKKILSANSEATCSCECLMEDEDFSSHVTRETFEEMCRPMMDKVSNVLEAAKAAAGVPLTAIDSIEVSGGASRVPWLKDMCSKAFGGKELSTTMNADECVARGTTLQAALLSPYFRVKEFKIDDCTRFSVGFTWRAMPPAGAEGGEDAESGEKTATVYPANSLMHLLKLATFFRKQPFELRARYLDDPETLPPGTSPELGTYRVEVPPRAKCGKVKVRAALTVHGTFVIEGAQLLEDDVGAAEISSPAPPPSPAPQVPFSPARSDLGDDADGKGEEDQGGGPQAKKKRGSAEDGMPSAEERAQRRKRHRRTDLVVSATGCPGLSASLMQKLLAEEAVMQEEMREFVETSARKNDLESYILFMRRNIGEGEKYFPFVAAEPREQLAGELAKAEDWLYDHMDDGKQAFVDKLAMLKTLGDPIVARYTSSQRRPELCAALQGLSTGCRKASPEAFGATCDSNETWLAELREKQESGAMHDDAAALDSEIEKRTEELFRKAVDVLGEGPAKALRNGGSGDAG